MYFGKSVKFMLAAMLFAASCASAQAADLLKPYVLAYTTTTGTVASVTDAVKAKLTGAGFKIVGSYSPFDGANVLVVTNDALLKAAASSDRGGYLAPERVTITKQYGNGKGAAFNPASADIQVAFTNPVYWAAAYRVTADVSAVKAALVAALGNQQEYGSFYDYKNGISANDVRDYRYMIFMEEFTDPSDLGSFADHATAVKAVETGLGAHAGGTSEVYRIDIPGTQETVFGVALTQGCSADAHIMKTVDMGPIHNTGYAPYEILVDGKHAEALYARFRIAISYLGLPMVSNPTGGTFMDIMCAPDSIKHALMAATGKK